MKTCGKLFACPNLRHAASHTSCAVAQQPHRRPLAGEIERLRPMTAWQPKMRENKNI